MALTRTWTVKEDTLLAKSGSTPLGGGNDEHLPIGMAGSYYCKAALRFNNDWTGVTKVISARLYLKTTTKVHATAWGATPSIYVERQSTGSFQENSGRSSYDSPAGSGWSTASSDFDSANVQPTGLDRVTWTPGNNESTWYSVDITAMANSWAPSSVLRSTGTPGGNAANYGLLIRPTANATSETIEFYSRKSGSDPYIVLTYDSNTAPNAPTNPSPGIGYVMGQSIACSFLYDDPQNDNSSAFQVQVATDAAFTTIVHDSGVVALVQADNTTINYTIPGLLTRGTTYYWRALTIDAAGLASVWSSTWNFIINSLPVATLTEPSATGRIAKVTYQAGSGWTQPRLVVEWSYSDAQGQGQTQYEIDVRADSGGSPGTVIVNTVVAGAATQHIVTQNIIENTRYHIRVRSFDGLEWGNWSGYFIVRARWGYTVHTKDVRIAGAPPTSWSVPVVNAPVDTATQALAIEYNSGTNGTSGGLMATWQPSLATVVKNNFVYYRVWFMAWGASPAPLPALLDLTIRTSGLTVQPERWLPNPISGQGGSIEFSDRVFGTQCMRIDGNGTSRRISQQVPVEPDTNYVLQGRVKSYGNSGALIFLSDTQTGAVLLTPTGAEVATPTVSTDLPWTQLIAPVWNSGSRTSVWVGLATRTGNVAGSVALFDGLKMERGRVTSPWTPGLVGVGVAIDSGGVQIDATNSSGAIFRLRAAGGQIIQLGASALEWQGQALLPAPYVSNSPPAGPVNGQLWWDDDDATTGPDLGDTGTVFPLAPGIGRRYFRSDYNTEFIWTGARWLSTQLFPLFGSAEVASATYFVSRTASVNRWQGVNMALPFGVDWWLEYITHTVLVNSGATALSAAHKWDILYQKGSISVPTTVVGSVAIDSGANDIERNVVTPVGALLDVTNNPWITANVVKTGTPGDLSFHTLFAVYARIVAT